MPSAAGHCKLPQERVSPKNLVGLGKKGYLSFSHALSVWGRFQPCPVVSLDLVRAADSTGGKKEDAQGINLLSRSPVRLMPYSPAKPGSAGPAGRSRTASETPRAAPHTGTKLCTVPNSRPSKHSPSTPFLRGHFAPRKSGCVAVTNPGYTPELSFTPPTQVLLGLSPVWPRLLIVPVFLP